MARAKPTSPSDLLFSFSSLSLSPCFRFSLPSSLFFPLLFVFLLPAFTCSTRHTEGIAIPLGIRRVNCRIIATCCCTRAPPHHLACIIPDLPGNGKIRICWVRCLLGTPREITFDNVCERFEWNDEDTDFATARIFQNKISMVIFRRRFFVLKLNPSYSIELLNLARWKRLIESNFVPILKRNERVP